MCCELLLSRQTQRVTVRGVLFTAPAAPTLAVQLGAGGAGRPPPSQLPQPLLQLTAYPHSTARASCCSIEAGVEEEGTTCSVVQPHLLRPHRHRSMSTAYVVRLATQDNWVWRLLPPPRTSCLPEHEVENRDSRPLRSAPSCDKFQSHLHLERRFRPIIEQQVLFHSAQRNQLFIL